MARLNKSLLLASFGLLVTVSQYRRLVLRLELEDLQQENTILREKLPPAVISEVCVDHSYDTAHPLRRIVHTVYSTVTELAPGDGETSGVATYVFLALMAGYMAKVICWLKSELHLYAAIDRKAMNDDKRYNLSNFFSYRADYWLSTTTYAKPLALGTFTLLIILFGGVLRCFLMNPPIGASLWDTWIFVVDTSAHADEQETTGRLSALLMTVLGMVIFAMMVGLISDGLAAQLDALQSGSAPVIEYGHVVILGWSDRTLPVIQELAIANLSKGGAVIAVMAEKEKLEMERLLDYSAIDLHGSKVVFRTGCSTMPHDLEHVSIKGARVTIVLSPVDETDNADEADGFILRVVLCLKGLDLQGHVVVELQDVDNQELIHIVGGSLIESVVAHDFIGRLIVQSGRQQGLAPVMESLLGFEGNEFYIRRWTEMVGEDFCQVLFYFEDAIPFGVLTADGKQLLNPPDGYIIQQDDELLFLAEDEDTYRPAPKPFRTVRDVAACEYEPTGKFEGNQSTVRADHTLMIGWRRDLGDILMELNENVVPGSTVTIMSQYPDEDGARDRELASNGRRDPKDFENLTVSHIVANPLSRVDLDRLPLDKYRTVFILHEQGQGSRKADSCIVTTLFLLRDVYKKQMEAKGTTHVRPFTVISEVLDPRTKHQLLIANVPDFVMSNQVVSAALAMVAENRRVNRILGELLQVEGAEIYLHDFSQYCPSELVLSFWDIAVIVRHAGFTCMGYLLKGQKPQLNPPNKDLPRLWAADDKLIILADL